jgi:hypothetical protein
MSDIFNLGTDQTILGLDGNIAANGQAHFYDKKTGAYAPVYGDAGLSVSLRQPVQADAAGVLPPIYLDDAVAYRAVIADRKNNRIREIDEVRRQRDGIKVVAGINALKRYCGNDPFVLVATKGGCPVFYKRLSGCDLPAEHLPDVVRAECGCDCSVAWQLCRSQPDICAMETAELNCDYQVLVQECPREVDPEGIVNPDGSAEPCHRAEGSGADAAPAVKKASIGALLSAAAQCLPRACIRHDAPELALVDGGLVYGDREPPPLEWSDKGGSWGECLRVMLATDPDLLNRHLQMDKVKDVFGNPLTAPQITFTNPGPCRRRYEVRALNRLNRARELAAGFGGAPVVSANFQTRFGKQGNALLDDPWGVADFRNTLKWLDDFSIADSTMGPFLSGHLGFASGPPNNWENVAGANGYTENDLIVDLNPGQTITCVLKYHVYWDMSVVATKFIGAERLHFGTRIMARQVR